MKVQGPKCRFCGARFSPATIRRKTVMKRMREHMEKFHAEEWGQLQQQIREICHRAPLRADHPALYA